MAKLTTEEFIKKAREVHGDDVPLKFSIMGQKAIMNCGLEAEVIEDNGYKDITIRFSNGIVKEHCPRHAFRKKKLTPIVRKKGL